MGYAVEEPKEQKAYVTVEEYFALEEVAEYRSEYTNGRMEMMAGASIAHNDICANVYGNLFIALRKKPCRYFASDLKVAIETKKTFYYPDAMVICGEVQRFQEKDHLVTNPILVVEVLSPSTEQKDRGEKFIAYQKLPSFKEYVLISQDQFSVEIFFKQDEKSWLYRRFTEEDEMIPLQSIDSSIRLGDLYENVVFAEPEIPPTEEPPTE